MVFFNYALRKLNAKIVYYGPGLCGKTTNLQWIHDHFEGGQRGKMISLATEGDRTIFFDLLPIDIGTIRGMDVTLQLYTVPGQVHYNSTRQLVLRGADGVVYVADSQRTMKASNVESFENLQENLMLQGIDLKSFPHVLQFNKRDLRDLLSTEDLNESLNLFSVPIFEAIATEGIGVQETLEGIVKLVMRNLREKYEPVANATGPQAPAPMPIGGPTPFRAPAAEPPKAPVVPASVAPPAAMAPPADDEAGEGGIDAGFSAFQDEDEIPTNVYESSKHDPYAETAGSRTPVIDAGAIAAAESGTADEPDRESETAVEASSDDEFEGLFTDPRDEDGTNPEIRLPPPVVAPERKPEIDRSTDPEIVPDSLDAEQADENLDDLFEPETHHDDEPSAEIVIDRTDDDFAFGRFDEPEDEPEAEPEAEPERSGDLDFAFQSDDPEDSTDEPVAESEADRKISDDDFAFGHFGESSIEATPVAPPTTDRYEDRIEAPGPFAPAPKRSGAETAVAGGVGDEQAVHDEVRQALGAAEDLEALKALYSDDAGAFDLPAEMAPVMPPPDESSFEPEVDESSFEPEVDESEVDESSFEPEVDERELLPPFEPPDETVPEAPQAESLPDFPFDDQAVRQMSEENADEPPLFDPGAHPADVGPETGATPDDGVEAEPTPAFDEAFEPELPPPPPPVDPMMRSRPFMVGSGDPFADDESEAVLEVPAASVVPVSRGINVTAEDNQLHLQLKGSGAIAEMGQVRALDIEVPVPGQWVGNRKVTLQLRLTLTPAEDDDD